MRIPILLALLAASAAAAHQPLWNEGSPAPEAAFEIETPRVSKAIFGTLAAGGIAWFALDTPDGFRLDARVFAGGGCDAAFRPRLWLLGPGLDGRADPRGAGLEPPAGHGALAAAGGWEAYRGHGLRGWAGPEVVRELPAGRHYLALQAPPVGGVYLLSLGGREAFGGSAEGRAGIGRFNGCEATR